MDLPFFLVRHSTQQFLRLRIMDVLEDFSCFDADLETLGCGQFSGCININSNDLPCLSTAATRFF
jgi:hypothetical protein